MPLQFEFPSALERSTIRRRPLSISVISAVPVPVLMDTYASLRRQSCPETLQICCGVWCGHLLTCCASETSHCFVCLSINPLMSCGLDDVGHGPVAQWPACALREPEITGYCTENRRGFTVGSLRKAPGTVVRWSSGSLRYPSCAYWKDTGRRRPRKMKSTDIQ